MKSLVAAVLFLSVVNLISGDITSTVPHNNGSNTTVNPTSSRWIPTLRMKETTRGVSGTPSRRNETEASTIPHNNTAENNTLSTTEPMKISISKSSIPGKPELSSTSASKSHSTVPQPTNKSTTQLTPELHSPQGTTKKTLLIEEVNPGNPGNDVKEQPPSYQKGLFIGVGCVVAVIICVVLVFLYKICKKKPPEAETGATKVSAQEKESVKLLSVKTSAADSDGKGTPLPHTEYIIEC